MQHDNANEREVSHNPLVKYYIETMPEEIVTEELCSGRLISDISNPVIEVNCVINDKPRACHIENNSDEADVDSQYQNSVMSFTFEISPLYCHNGENIIEITYRLKNGAIGSIYRNQLRAVKMPEELFNASFYYMCYSETIPEIKKIGHDAAKLKEYYYCKGIACGQRSGLTFSPDFYKMKNHDLQQMDYCELYRHFVLYTIGHNEMRETSEFMNLAIYKESNVELRILDFNVEQLLEHAENSGYIERRHTTDTEYLKRFYDILEVKEYASMNPDVMRKCGVGMTYESARDLMDYFFEYSMACREWRKASFDFDIRSYIKNNGLENKSASDIFWTYIYGENICG